MVRTIDKLREKYRNIEIHCEFRLDSYVSTVSFTFKDNETYYETFRHDVFCYETVEKELLMIISKRRKQKLKRIINE